MTPNPPRILVVEDDARIAEELREVLSAEGYEPLRAANLAAAREHLQGPLALVLLDLGLPDGDGLDLCRRLARSRPELPVIVTTARTSVNARVRGLDAGADDYVVKPFHTVELIARVRSVLRRRGGPEVSETVAVGPVWADAERHAAGRGDAEFDLKPREFELLLFFLRHPGRPWTRDQLLERVWGPEFRGDTRTVDTHVRRLRAALEEQPGSPRFLHTEWGVGYRFEEHR